MFHNWSEKAIMSVEDFIPYIIASNDDNLLRRVIINLHMGYGSLGIIADLEKMLRPAMMVSSSPGNCNNLLSNRSCVLSLDIAADFYSLTS
jgi:hypothetical protein